MSYDSARIGSYLCGPDQPLLVIAGPCVLEDEAGALEIAEAEAAVVLLPVCGLPRRVLGHRKLVRLLPAPDSKKAEAAVALLHLSGLPRRELSHRKLVRLLPAPAMMTQTHLPYH